MSPGSDEMEPALLKSIMLSDTVIREGGTNKLSLIGIFAQFNASKFPFQIPLFYATPFITNLSGTHESIAVVLRIENPSTGDVLASASGTIQPGEAGSEPAPIDRDVIFEIPYPFPGVVFPEAGRYVIKALINGEEIGERFFKVLSVSAQ